MVLIILIGRFGALWNKYTVPFTSFAKGQNGTSSPIACALLGEVVQRVANCQAYYLFPLKVGPFTLFWCTIT